MSTFLEEFHLTSHLDAEDLALRWVKFDVKAYRDALYREYDVYLAPSMQTAVAKRKAEYLAGRYCAQSALASLGYPWQHIIADEKRCPQFPRGSVGSITHSHGVALAAVSSASNASLGIDFERIVDAKQARKMAKMVLTPQEMQVFTHQGLSEELAFTTVFSLKESFFKAAYPAVGQYFGFEAVEVLSIDLAQRVITVQVCQPLASAFSPGDIFYAKYTWFDTTVLSSVILPLEQERG